MNRLFLFAAGFAALFAQSAVAAQFEPKLSFKTMPGERAVALTFDACSGAFDDRIFEALMQGDIKATIFVTDRWIRHNPGNLKLLQSRPDLFQIENHGAEHVPPVTDALEVFGIRSAGTIDAVRAEVEGGSRSIQTATGRRPVWYRGATARYSADAMKAIADMKFRIAGYSLNADNGASLPAGVVERHIRQAKPGDVVIAHINQPHRPSGAGVAAGIQALKDAGWRFVRLEDVEPVEDDQRRLVVEPHETAEQPVTLMAKARKPLPAATKPADEAKAASADAAPIPDTSANVSPVPPEAAAPALQAEAEARPSMQIKPRLGGVFRPAPGAAWPGRLSPPKAPSSAPPEPRANP
ncbi:polysaccharide deacetylase family protein [Chelatococcus sambhunathii]|nr:polysaccharide deacetylase family protein [Chelatococcus sambhunathii]